MAELLLGDAAFLRRILLEQGGLSRQQLACRSTPKAWLNRASLSVLSSSLILWLISLNLDACLGLAEMQNAASVRMYRGGGASAVFRGPFLPVGKD